MISLRVSRRAAKTKRERVKIIKLLKQKNRCSYVALRQLIMNLLELRNRRISLGNRFARFPARLKKINKGK